MADVPHPTHSPASWDRLLNTAEHPLSLADTLTQLPATLSARRALQLAITTRDAARISTSVAALEQFKDTPVTGVRLMAAVAMGHYPHILATEESTLSSLDPTALEDACDEAFARGTAHGETQDWPEALAHLRLALKLAEGLGMVYRAQHVDIEIGRLYTALGTPQPQRIINAMERLPLTGRRRAWSERVLAVAYIAQGDYAAAHRQLLSHGSTDLTALTAGLLGQPIEVFPEGIYQAPAQALHALRAGKPLTCPPIPGTGMDARYGALFRAWAMLRTRAMANQARNLLIDCAVRTPDQRAHRAAALIQANAVDALGDDIDHLIAEFNDALNQMTVRKHFLALLRAIHPDAYVLLGMLPGIHQEVAESLPEIAILTGSAVTYQYMVHKLPGRDRGGNVLVMSAVTGHTGPESRPHPSTHQRIRDAVAALGVSTSVNLGHAILALITFRAGARASRLASWTDALDRALAWVDSVTLREDLRAHARL
ncbi:hypothetical protein [Deinococcus soli (ex Cha et al. 2016)]|uniref:hypothetical protein n=1 Tax=Deinococcus soli (ex Cha et al. 2016) TaxID=1309411 RepID=UPI001665D121|nr:hypothetical protein [Deinococcus soli (ex Cha et al. 2016)]GGB69021.1 hypothetical protein GCM10008019_26550 [Deinococcus soli (ex Cha et al. 2016)]